MLAETMSRNKRGSGPIAITILVILTLFLTIISLVQFNSKSNDAEAELKNAFFVNNVYYRAAQISFYIDQSARSSLSGMSKSNFDESKFVYNLKSRLALAESIYPELSPLIQNLENYISYSDGSLSISMKIGIREYYEIDLKEGSDYVDYELNFGRTYIIL